MKIFNISGDVLKMISNFEAQTKELNKLWMRKTFIFYIFLLFVFLVLLLDVEVFWLNSYVEIVASFVPMVKGLMASNVKNWNLAAKYFSLMAICLPIFVIWVIWKDDVVARCSHGWSRMRAGPFQVLGFVYFVGLPSLCFVIYLVFVAPFGYSDKPGNFGQTIFFLMLNSEVGLALLGSVFGVCFGQLLIFVCWIISFPFALLFKKQ